MINLTASLRGHPEVAEVLAWLVMAGTLGASCVHGPDTEKKSVLDYLSGKHYQMTGNVGGVPLIERQAVSTRISGRAVVGEGALAPPLAHRAVELCREGRVVLEAMTDASGTFVFAGEVPNGSYDIRVKSDEFAGKLRLLVSDYKHEGLSLVVTQRMR